MARCACNVERNLHGTRGNMCIVVTRACLHCLSRCTSVWCAPRAMHTCGAFPCNNNGQTQTQLCNCCSCQDQTCPHCHGKILIIWTLHIVAFVFRRWPQMRCPPTSSLRTRLPRCKSIGIKFSCAPWRNGLRKLRRRFSGVASRLSSVSCAMRISKSCLVHAVHG